MTDRKRKLVNLIKKQILASRPEQERLEKKFAEFSQTEIDNAYPHAESELLAKSMRERMMGIS